MHVNVKPDGGNLQKYPKHILQQTKDEKTF